MINVINKFKDKHYYIGRGSILGNPFVMIDKSDEERNRVCEEFEKHFNNKVFIEKNQSFLNELDKLHNLSLKEDINLGCFCAPKRCHGDTIKNFLDNYQENLKKIKD